MSHVSRRWLATTDADQQVSKALTPVVLLTTPPAVGVIGEIPVQQSVCLERGEKAVCEAPEREWKSQRFVRTEKTGTEFSWFCDSPYRCVRPRVRKASLFTSPYPIVFSQNDPHTTLIIGVR
jgi:hypothetical protein